MNNTIKTLCLLVICSALHLSVAIGQKNLSEQSRFIKKTLPDSSWIKGNIITLLENDSFLIETRAAFLDLDFDVWLKNHPGLIGNKENAFAVFKQRTKEIADLLAAGKCLVYKKNDGTLVKTILIEYYANKYVAGRRFRLMDNHVFFERIDGEF